MTSGGSKYSRFLSATFLQTRVRLFVASIQSQTRSRFVSFTQSIRNCDSY